MGAIDEKELYDRLKNHDWYFQYSDDSIVWHNGKESLNNLIVCLQEVKKNQPELLKIVKSFYEEKQKNDWAYEVLKQFISKGN